MGNPRFLVTRSPNGRGLAPIGTLQHQICRVRPFLNAAIFFWVLCTLYGSTPLLCPNICVFTQCRPQMQSAAATPSSTSRSEAAKRSSAAARRRTHRGSAAVAQQHAHERGAASARLVRRWTARQHDPRPAAAHLWLALLQGLAAGLPHQGVRGIWRCLRRCRLRADAPCRVAEVAPVGVAVQEAAVVGINRQWPYEAWLPLVYGALAPSRKLQPAVAQMVRRAAAGGGPRWAAVHLRIERDWWIISGFCTARRFPHRRCYPPSEVASLTAASRLRRNVSGVVLVYAADNVARSGPEVRPEQFGARVLSLPSAPESTGH